MDFPVYFYFIGISFLASLSIAFRRDTVRYLSLFSLFLMATEAAEIFGLYLKDRRQNNVVLYNLFTTVEFLFYFFVLYQIIYSVKVKKIIFHTSWIYVLLFFINVFFIQKITVFHTMTYSLGCLLIATICIYYFLELFQLEHSVKLARQPAFWICSGLLFFYACSFPIFALANFISALPYVIIKNLSTIIDLLNIFLYSAFTIAFLCRLRIGKSMSSS